MLQKKLYKTAITPTRAENFPEWYQKVISEAELAENSSIRGCMIIKPYGYSIWENIQKLFDSKIKKLGVQNAYFPLLIPIEFLQKEADHIDGFAKECAVVTHHRLTKNDDGILVPDGKLQHPYIIRPTSEVIIGHTISKWITTYRDLPLKLNQWCNVMRWEMRPRVFLRTSEFLWQEGHTVFATKEEASNNAKELAEIYYQFMQNELALPAIKGEKTEEERFPGACNTYTIEVMMQDGKALQAGTSHDLGQTFAKAFDINFTDKDGIQKTAYTASWGISTRLIGGIIMAHSDDNGLILPTSVAPYQVVIIPILNNKTTEEIEDRIQKKCIEICKHLEDINIRTYIDCSYLSTQDKIWKWIKKGVPMRIEIGERELDSNTISVYRRDQSKEEKLVLDLLASSYIDQIQQQLNEYDNNIRTQAIKMRERNIKCVDSVQQLDHVFNEGFQGWVNINKEITDTDEFKIIAKKHSLSRRCIPMDNDTFCKYSVIVAKSY